MNETIQTVDNSEELDRLKMQAEAAEETPVTKAESEAAAEQAADEKAGAVAAAHGAMAVVTMVLKTMCPYLVIDPKQTAEVADAVAPVLEKYGLHLGGAWNKELTAVSAVGTFGFIIYGQMKAHALEQQQKSQAVEHGEK